MTSHQAAARWSSDRLAVGQGEEVWRSFASKHGKSGSCGAPGETGTGATAHCGVGAPGTGAARQYRIVVHQVNKATCVSFGSWLVNDHGSQTQGERRLERGSAGVAPMLPFSSQDGNRTLVQSAGIPYNVIVFYKGDCANELTQHAPGARSTIKTEKTSGATHWLYREQYSNALVSPLVRLPNQSVFHIHNALIIAYSRRKV